MEKLETSIVTNKTKEKPKLYFFQTFDDHGYNDDDEDDHNNHNDSFNNNDDDVDEEQPNK